MLNSTKYFIFILYEAKRFKYEKLQQNENFVSVKKIIKSISNQFLKEEPLIKDYFLLHEDESFFEASFIDFKRYNNKEFVLLKPSRKLKDILAIKKSSDEAKAKEFQKISKFKSTLSSLIAKATKAKVELKNRRPANNANSNNNNNLNYANYNLNNANLNLNRNVDERGNWINFGDFQAFYYDVNSNNFQSLELNREAVGNQIRNQINQLNPLLNARDDLNLAQNHLVQPNYTLLRRSFRNRNQDWEGDDDDEEEYAENSESEYDSEEEIERFEELLSTLIGMGFNFEDSERALRRVGNNLQWAIEILINMRPISNNP